MRSSRPPSGERSATSGGYSQGTYGGMDLDGRTLSHGGWNRVFASHSGRQSRNGWILGRSSPLFFQSVTVVEWDDHHPDTLKSVC